MGTLDFVLCLFCLIALLVTFFGADENLCLLVVFLCLAEGELVGRGVVVNLALYESTHLLGTENLNVNFYVSNSHDKDLDFILVLTTHTYYTFASHHRFLHRFLIFFRIRFHTYPK